MEGSSSLDRIKGYNQPKDRVLKKVPLKEIYPNIYQPRPEISELTIKRMAESIAPKGDVDEAIDLVYRPSSHGKFMLIDGECRWRGCLHLKLKDISATVKSGLTDLEIMAISLRTFTLKNDIHILDKAGGVKRMMDEAGLSAKESAPLVGYTPDYVRALLKLLDLHPDIQDKFRKKEVKLKVAQELAGYSQEEQLDLLARCTKEEKLNKGKSLSVDDACHLVRKTAESRRMKKRSGSDARGRTTLSAAQLAVNGVTSAIDILTKSLIRLGNIPSSELEKMKNPFPNELANDLDKLVRVIDIRVKKLRAV